MIEYLQNISSPDKHKTTEEPAVKPPQDDSGTRNNDIEAHYADLLNSGAKEGIRNQSATSLTGHLFAKGLAAEEVWSILQLWNSKNTPPIDHSELRKTFESVKRLATQNKTECNKDKEYDISNFLDTPEKVAAEYDEQYVRVSMASFKESGSIEYEASWLGILAAVEETENGYNLKQNWEKIVNHDGNIDLIVFKAKRGTGETGKVPLKLDKANMTVRDRIESSKFDSVGKVKKPSKF